MSLKSALAESVLVSKYFYESPLEVTVLPKPLKSVTCSMSSSPSLIPVGELLIDVALVSVALIYNPNFSASLVILFKNY